MNYYQENIDLIFELIKKEEQRQKEHIELIASENFVSKNVLAITGSILTNKYAEGYPGKRYYGGCEYIDQLENLAIEFVKKMFNCNFANVQPHSGSTANFAVYLALVPPGGTVLGMDINAGGHLSHGTKVSFSGKIYNAITYGVKADTNLIDYDEVEKKALEHKPSMIIVGASNYSRIIDFARFRAIADKVNAILFADMAHIAGLIVAKVHPNCFPYADVMMTTTHKTLRGPRGAILAWNDPKLTKRINSAVFPGAQGGPLEHVIAAKAAAFAEALTPEFTHYAKDVVENAYAFCEEFKKENVPIVANGTDNHLFTIDVLKGFQITGDLAEKWFHAANITTNKNSIPFDTNKPQTPSGVRLGTAAMTTRGFKKEEFQKLAKWMCQILRSKGDEKVIEEIKNKVLALLADKPIFEKIS